MQIHRLMRKEHSESLLKGSFWFVRLRYYQMLEVVFEDASIGDELEGSAYAVVNAKFTPENVDDPIRKNLALSGISFGGDGHYEFQNTTIRNDLDCFVSCWSTTKTPNLSGGGSDYDTCVTAADADSLADCLSTHGVERESGVKISDLFYVMAAGPVHYESFEHDMSTEPLPSGNPFRKRTRYQDQFEYRLVLRPRQTMTVDSLFIQCPQATELLTSVSIGQPSETTVRTETERWEELLASIHDEFTNLQSKLADQGSRPDQWTEANAEFDLAHLKNLRRALFELRSPPFDESLDLAIALRFPSNRLIHLYERRLRQRSR